MNRLLFHNKEYKATCLTVGNPHCIIFMDQVTPELAKELGPYVENADEFPEKMNLQICRKIDTGNLDIEIWERGSGYTKASGTGSCAAAVAAYRLGLVENRVNVNQPGGMIQIDIKDDDTIYMTGSSRICGGYERGGELFLIKNIKHNYEIYSKGTV